jgi:hypothetical protein
MDRGHDGGREVIQVRVAGRPDLAERAIHEGTCASIAKRAAAALLEPVQVLEVYLVIDSSVPVFG